MVAAVQLKLHFDGLLDELAARPAGATVAPSPFRVLRDQPAGPGFIAGEILGDEPPSGPRAVVGSTAGEAAPDSEEVGGGASIGGSVSANGSLPADGGAPGGLWVDPASSGRPWSALGAVEGLLTFRGNPSRTFHGRGPIPIDPIVAWTHAIGCSNSPVGNEPKEWCGTGWTGQPSVFRLPPSGRWTVAFGSYDRSVNFLDPATGATVLPPYRTGDIIKGSVTVDPDGFPLLYTGSRDNFFHVVALDRPVPEALWRLSSDADGPTVWNNDWDSSALVVDDHLLVGGENGRFYVVKLNRTYGADARVRVDPEVVFSTESWDSELLAAISDRQASIENSVAISGDTVYFSNSAGLVQGWRIGGLADGQTPEQVFRYWSGDDTDASIVIDEAGMLYLGSEYERLNDRSRDVGQILKLDPSNPTDPVVWSRQSRAGPGSGIWATPALYEGLVIIATNEGELIGLDRDTGADRWRIPLDGPLWSSPVVVGDTLIQADCGGFLHAFDLTDGGVDTPTKRWSIELAGCLESTPAVWDGRIFIGSRSGTFFAVTDRAAG